MNAGKMKFRSFKVRAHANLIYLARTPLLLCVNDRSLLSVLAPGRDFTKILSLIKRRIAELKQRIGPPKTEASQKACPRWTRTSQSFKIRDFCSYWRRLFKSRQAEACRTLAHVLT